MRRVLLVLATVFALGWAAGRWLPLPWDKKREDFVVQDDGTAISRILTAEFVKRAEIRVGGIAGSVQSTGNAARAMGMLNTSKVAHYPYTVDYFVDLRRITQRDLVWDANARTLTVYVPDITAGQPNVDTSAVTASETRGLFVTRGAADELARKVALAARNTARKEAAKPEHIIKARDNAREVVARLVSMPLRAANVPPVRVEVRFPGDTERQAELWDSSAPWKRVYQQGR